ncbi:MAG: DnaA N-terminal domain-containing protein, partial [Candidatus Eiseniibacteriota bacterium]
MSAQPTLPEVTTHLWGQVLTAVQTRLETQQAFDTWLKPIVPLSLSPHLAELEVPNPFFIDWIHQYHLPSLRLSLREVLGTEPEIRFTTRDPSSAAAVADALPPTPEPAAEPAVAPRDDRA